MGRIAYIHFDNKRRERKLMAGLNCWVVPKAKIDHFIERLGIVKQIAQILQPVTDYDSYHMIIGHPGTGKTTLVQHIGHQYSGIIYVHVNASATSDQEFAKVFSKALGQTPYYCNWLKFILQTKSSTIPQRSNSGKFGQNNYVPKVLESELVL